MRAPRKPAPRRTRRSPRGQLLLNVKMRAVTARKRRKKMAWGIASLVLAVGTACGILWITIGTLLDRFFYSNPAYTLREIVLDLDGTMDAEAARDRTGIAEGANIFAVDIAGAARRLAAVPAVADVQIERRLPDRIEITLVARDPVARIGSGGAAHDQWLVDDSGFVVQPEIWKPEFDSLPEISGGAAPGGQGVVLADADYQNAFSLLRAVRARGGDLFAIARLDISKDYCLDVETPAGAKIKFAPDGFADQLARLEKLLAHCRDTGRQLESVNLMVRRNTPVKFAMNTPPASTAEVPRKNKNLPN